MLRIPAAPSRIPPAKCGRFHSLRYRIETVQVSERTEGGTTHVSFRFGGMILVSDYTIPYTSAEIPPAGAPSGFDSAAILYFIA